MWSPSIVYILVLDSGTKYFLVQNNVHTYIKASNQEIIWAYNTLPVYALIIIELQNGNILVYLGNKVGLLGALNF